LQRGQLTIANPQGVAHRVPFEHVRLVHTARVERRHRLVVFRNAAIGLVAELTSLRIGLGLLVLLSLTAAALVGLVERRANALSN